MRVERPVFCIIVAVTVLAVAAAGQAAPIRFDFGSTTNSGWTAAGTGGGTVGPVTVAVSAIGGGVWADARNRGTASTPQGVDNNNPQVPAGTYGDMYRDFIFANGSDTAGEGLDLSLSGLAPDTDYTATLWAYDSGSANPARSADWGPAGGTTLPLTFEGDGGGPGPDPNTNSLADYSALFGFTTDATGGAVIEGRTNAASGGPHNVFLNGLEIEPVRQLRYQVDIDVGADVTEPGWTSLDVSGTTGSVTDHGVTFTVVSAAGSRDRGGPSPLARDFVFDDGGGAAVGLQVFTLPDGVWDASVWAYDDDFPTGVGELIVGITSSAGQDIFTDSFVANPDEPFTFRFDSSTLPDGFTIFTRESNSANRSRLNALRLEYVPEPATCTLLALGAIAGLRRRRRQAAAGR